jgi:hypothetical protein
VKCVRHHTVLHNFGFLTPSEWSLYLRGFADGDAADRCLCRLESARVGKNAASVSGLAKLFPGRIPACEQRPVRMSAETSSSPKCARGPKIPAT